MAHGQEHTVVVGSQTAFEQAKEGTFSSGELLKRRLLQRSPVALATKPARGRHGAAALLQWLHELGSLEEQSDRRRVCRRQNQCMQCLT